MDTDDSFESLQYASDQAKAVAALELLQLHFPCVTCWHGEMYL